MIAVQQIINLLSVDLLHVYAEYQTLRIKHNIEYTLMRTIWQVYVIYGQKVKIW